MPYRVKVSGVMGVPITFLDHYNPEQFEIGNCSAYPDEKCFGMPAVYVNGQKKYARLTIKRRTDKKEDTE